MYLPETNVLLTRFMTRDGVCVLDLMPVPANEARLEAVPNCVMRIVKLVYGQMTLDVRCNPRFDYARAGHTAREVEKGIEFVPENGHEPVRLLCSAPLRIEDNAACAMLDIKEGDAICFALDTEDTLPKLRDNFNAILQETIDFWKVWLSRSTYRGRYREVVLRSALTLKLLSSDEFGAIVAAMRFAFHHHMANPLRY